MHAPPLRNQNGQTIIGAVFGVTILFTAAAAFTQFMNGQNREIRRMNQKFSAIRTNLLLNRSFADPFTCSCLVENFGITIPGITPPSAPVNLNRVGGGSCSGSGHSPAIATKGTYINNENRLGVWVKDIYLDNITFGARIGPIPPLLPDELQEVSARLTIGFGSNPTPGTDDGQVVGLLRPAETNIVFLRNPATGAIVDCQGVTGAVASAHQQIDQIRTDLIADASAVIATLQPPPPPPPIVIGSGGPATPPASCSGFSGTPTILNANTMTTSSGSKIGELTVSNASPTGVVAFEVQVDGVLDRSWPMSSAGASTTGVFQVSSPTGSTVNVTVVAIDNNGCRSSMSAPRSVVVN